METMPDTTKAPTAPRAADVARERAGGSGPWRRLGRKLREVGPLYAAQRLAERIVPRSLFRLNAVAIVAVDIRDPSVRAREHDPEIRWATLDDLDSLAAAGTAPALARARLEGGGRAALLESGGEPVACFWYAYGAHDQFDWLRVTLAPGDVWQCGAWVAPGFRGRGLFGRLNNFAAAHHFRAGFGRHLGAIDALNRNSMRASAKLNSRILGRIFFLRLLGLTLIRANRAWRLGRWGPSRRLEVAIAGEGIRINEIWYNGDAARTTFP